MVAVVCLSPSSPVAKLNEKVNWQIGRCALFFFFRTISFVILYAK